MTRRFLSIAEFAETFGIGKRTVSDLIARGVIPVVELGRRRLIPAAVVDTLERRALEGFDAEVATNELAAS